ncbi:MAG: DNA polymerase III subunit alpha [Bacteroidales bacterium]|nr:DNA polymerase III subunit alpha [Bacteroidales bacterium]
MFTHLHVHSQYSVLDGMSKVPELVNKAIRCGMPAIALTDHGNMYGIKELLDYCKGVNKQRKEEGLPPFKPIVGVEAYCARRGRLNKSDEKAINGWGREYIIDRSGWHLILLAKNMVGYHNLCKIVSAGFMDDAYYYSPRIDKELLEQYHEGTICSSACLGGELPQKIMNTQSRLTAVLPSTPVNAQRTVDEQVAKGLYNEAEEAILWFKNLFGEDYYIELQRHETQKPGGDQEVYQKQCQVNPVLIALARKHNIRLIATNDTHFVEEEHAEAHDRLICLSTNHYVDDVNRMHYTKQEWLKSPEEMTAIFSDIPEALDNTQEIVDKVEIYDIDHEPIMPLFPIPEDFGTEQQWREKYTPEQLIQEFTTDENGENPLPQDEADKKIKKLGGIDRLYRIKFEADYLKHLTMIGAAKRYGDPLSKEVEDRIRFELHVMKTMGFPGYFLIVMDFIRGAREELGVSVGPGRGSAAGSVVAYCLHITDLDPLKYDLLFERFLNPDRISLPDIDTDFDDAGRGKVLDWVSKKYGETHVAHIITYGTMATKSALADVGRVQRVPLQTVNDIKKLVPDAFPEHVKDAKGKPLKVNLKNCYQHVDELKQLLNGSDADIREMLTYAEQLEDTIRQVGIHACGVIIGADDLTKFAPLSSVEDKESKKRVLVTEYDGHVVESVGLIKMDFLGLKTLTIIKECLAQIKRAKGLDIDIDHIPLDDAETYKLFSEGKTVAVFQFESAGMQKYLRDLQPNVITDLIAMNALYRPGPLEYIPTFIKRKKGEEAVTYDDPDMEEYLKDTYGVTVYQEQVMLLSRKLAGFTRGESDTLREAMGKKKKDVLAKMKPQFIEQGKERGHDPKILEKIWHDWEAFASYAFNKSHAACYAWVAYQTGYLKAHYPAEFMAANLTVAKDDITTVTKYMDECRSLGIDVLEPDVNESDLNFTVNTQGAIRFGLGGIKGVGEGAVEAILTEREQNGKYTSIFNFLERVNLQACNRKTVENLAKCGALDCFQGIYREQILGQNDKGEDMLDVLMRYGNKYQADKQQQQNTLFGDMEGGIEIQKPELPKAPHMTTIERLNIEKDLIGIYLSAHPLDEYEFEVRHMGTIHTDELKWLDQHKKEIEITKRDGSKASKRRICLADWQGVTEETENEEGETISVNVHDRMKEILERHLNSPARLCGLVTVAEEKTGRSGIPYGNYVIEDYNGSYNFALFREQYQQMAPVLKPNVYVYLTGSLQQAGKDRQWFKEKPLEEAEFEFVIKQVELLQEVQDKHMEELTIMLPIEQVTQELIMDLTETIKKHPGKALLKIEIHDPSEKNIIHFTSQSYTVHVDKEFYHRLKVKKSEGVLNFSNK